jgi:MYXO-CTERM domain-containing protein
MCIGVWRPICGALLACLAVLGEPALARTITIEPDAYAPGTDLSNVSPYVKLGATAGALGFQPVYAAPITQYGHLTQGVRSTGRLGEHVFSWNPQNDFEWMLPYPSWPTGTFDPVAWQLTESRSLVISFAQPVTEFSLLMAELYGDAGPAFSDPVVVLVYDPQGRPIASLNADPAGLPDTRYLGVLQDDHFSPYPPAWPYGTFRFAAADIGFVVVGGASEPTTLDRLSFKFHPIPEPSTAGVALLALGAALAVRRRTRLTGDRTRRATPNAIAA